MSGGGQEQPAARARRRRRPVLASRIPRAGLWEVVWVHGESIGPTSGSVRSAAQLARLAVGRPDVAVHEVEVCVRCRWDHLLRSWPAGTPGTPRARRHPGDEPR